MLYLEIKKIKATSAKSGLKQRLKNTIFANKKLFLQNKRYFLKNGRRKRGPSSFFLQDTKRKLIVIMPG